MRWILSAMITVAAALTALPDLSALDKNEAKIAEAEKLLAEGEKLLFGAGAKNPSGALAFFKKARAALPKEADAPVLAAKISKAIGLALIGCKKHKEAAEELKPLAQTYADKSIAWEGKVWPQKPMSDWVEALRKARADLDASKFAEAIEAAGKVEGEAVSKTNMPGKSHMLAACYIKGAALMATKKHEEAAGLLLRCAEAEVERVAIEKQKSAEAARLESLRRKTPDAKDIPKEEPPPGKLEGPYLKAVNAGLDWLAAFQTENGSWSETHLEEKSADDPMSPPRVKFSTTDEETALACMALLRAGVKIDDSPRGLALKKGLAWIASMQSPTGRIPSNGGQYHVILAHAQYTWVLAEAVLRLDRPEEHKPALEKAVAFLLSAQNHGLGWRFGVKSGDNDTEHTGVCAMALARSRTASIEVPDDAFAGALRWLGLATDDLYGRTGYASKGDPGAGRMDSQGFQPVDINTATALAARALMGQDPRKGMLAKGYDLLYYSPPVWIPDKNINLKYGRYYTLAYALRPGADANYSLKRFADMIIANQETKGKAAGSWPSIDALAADGRIVGTCRCIISILNARGVNMPQPMQPPVK